MSTQAPLSVHEPGGAPKGGIVVVQEAFGVNDHIEDVCRRFAAEGWLAVAPHLYHRSGDPSLGYDDFTLILPHWEQLDAERILADVDVALTHLEGAGIPAANIGIVGFCMGGTVALVTTTEREVGAGVTFYGGGLKEGRFGFPPLVEAAPRLRAPWLGLFGDLDENILPADVEELRVAAASSGQVTDVVRYPDAGHGFHCDRRDSYHEASARDAWQRTLDWFGRFLLVPASKP
jgi:carboxymethylenebutenolidase